MADFEELLRELQENQNGSVGNQPANMKKSGFAAIIGRPNVGKSTLMNHMIGQKVAITSRKPQTTRNRIQTVYTCEKGQIVFLDTPGMHKAKTRLGEYMVRSAEGTIKDVDVILWLVEPETSIGPMDRQIAERLRKEKVPKILVINKVDKIKMAELPSVIAAFEKLGDFDDIIAVSARLGRNVDELLDTIFEKLPYGPMFFDEDTLTDQPQRQMVAEIIREKALRSLGEEIPHGIAVMIEQMKKREDQEITDIDASIVCEKDSHKGIIIGKNGQMLKKIGSLSRPDIEKLLGGHVNLKLWVKVRKGWRDSELLLKNFGYNAGDLS